MLPRRALEKDLDPRKGRQARMIAGVVFGLLWTIVPFLAPPWLAKHPAHEGLFSVPISILSLLLMAAGIRLWRAQSRINRQLIAAFTFALAMQPLLMIALKYAAHVSGSSAIVVLMAYWCIVMGLIAAAFDPRLCPMSLGYAGGFFVALYFPAFRYDAVACTNFIAVVTAAVVWSRRATELAIERQKRREELGTC